MQYKPYDPGDWSFFIPPLLTDFVTQWKQFIKTPEKADLKAGIQIPFKCTSDLSPLFRKSKLICSISPSKSK